MAQVDAKHSEEIDVLRWRRPPGDRHYFLPATEIKALLQSWDRKI